MSEIKLRVARMQSLLEEIAQERERQDAKWGWPRRHGMEKWFLILLEEMGEASECLLQMESGDKPGDWPASFEKEMVQVIAVGMAMLQQFREREESLGAWASRTVKDGVGAEVVQCPRCHGVVEQDTDGKSLHCAEPGNCWWGWRPDTQ